MNKDRLKEHLHAIVKAAAKANNAYRNAHPNAPLSRKARLHEVDGAACWSGFMEFPESSDLPNGYAEFGGGAVAAFQSFIEKLPQSARPVKIELDLDHYDGDHGAKTKMDMSLNLAGMQIDRSGYGFSDYQDYGAHHFETWLDLHRMFDEKRDGSEPEADWLVVRGGRGEALGHQAGRFEVTRLKACGEQEAALKALAISRGPRYILEKVQSGNYGALSAEVRGEIISRIPERSTAEILDPEYGQHRAVEDEMEMQGP